MDVFEGVYMQPQNSVLRHRIDLYFHDYKLALGVEEKGDEDRNIDHEIKRPKALEKELSCEFITTNPDEKDFNFFRAINEIHRHIKNQLKG